MTWKNIKLIMCREVRDQLRDRRMLFMIVVFPLLLYPLFGMSLVQVVQFVREQPTPILVMGTQELPDSPALLTGSQFDARYFDDPRQQKLLEVHLHSAADEEVAAEDNSAESNSPRQDRAELAREYLGGGKYQAVIVFPPGFSDRLQEFRESMKQLARGEESAAQADSSRQLPSPTVYFDTSSEKSRVTYSRTLRVLQKWSEAIGQENLKLSHLPVATMQPFLIGQEDVADSRHRDAAIWSKILPFLLLVWALTGAFYPAIDLCAGEKERGTLETLLVSPAQRTEIVWGKLFTVMIFSVMTSVLNLLSMSLTGTLVLRQLGAFGPPPLLTPVWLLFALLPVSALFSALCMALAAFARSTKEGQYYLMPLVTITLPLVVLPLSPGAELNLGHSLIPLSGIMLMLRSLMEGEFVKVLYFGPIVMSVTLFCCLMAIRWAVDQFNREGVLFRESERLDIKLWFQQLVRNRPMTPTAAMGLFCGMLILVIRFFLDMSGLAGQSVIQAALVLQLVAVLSPALFMTIMLTEDPKRALGLTWPGFRAIAVGGLLAFAINPVAVWIGEFIQRIYPVDPQILEVLSRGQRQVPLLAMFLVMSVVPAICEELAFRGFILSGLRHMGRKWWAILVSAFFFGAAHLMLQQSLSAAFIGVVIAYVAVQTGSILPCMFFHFVHNGMVWVLGMWLPQQAAGELSNPFFTLTNQGEWQYHFPAVVAGATVSAAILYWLHGRKYEKSAEEKLLDAIDHPVDRPAVEEPSLETELCSVQEDA